MTEVRRYGERLYDPAGPRYVTAAELRARRAAGEAVRILDAASGQDVTAVVLDSAPGSG